VSEPAEQFNQLFAGQPVILAPMESVTSELFRWICRQHGAELCVSEFVNAEGLLRRCGKARQKITIAANDQPTAIQIYGSDADRLADAARTVGQTEPPFIDINCGCWVSRIANRGAGAGWLRDPPAMVAMVDKVVRAVSVPVTVKTRIGIGTEKTMPIVELAQRLEQVGVAGMTLHCRTAKAGMSGTADWSWAGRVKQVVGIPVIVNGDIKSAQDVKTALAQTGCDGVMVGRRAIGHPWIFREARALLDRGEQLPEPTVEQRISLSREHLRANVAKRGEPWGVRMTRRHLGGYLRGLPGAATLRRTLFACDSLAGCLAILDEAQRRLAA